MNRLCDSMCDNMSHNERFQSWLQQKLDERDWTYADLASRAGIGKSTISMIMSGVRSPGTDPCLAIARALHIPAAEVYREAGLLPPEPELTEQKERLLNWFETLDTRGRQYILDTAERQAERQREERPQSGKEVEVP